MKEPADDAAQLFAETFEEHIKMARLTRDTLHSQTLLMLAKWVECARGGGKILFFGNGGSASQAQHFACELVVRIGPTRAALSAIALTADSTIITAAGNDFDFESIFARQIEAIGSKGDLAMGLSTTGNSPNVVNALEAARARGLARL